MRALTSAVARALGVIWPSAAEERERGWHRVDTLAALVLVAVAVVCFQGRWAGQLPFLDHDGDTQQLASYCAALDHPDWFKSDPLLSDPRNFAFYATIQIPLTRLLAPLVGDYGTALLIPLPLILLGQGFGFYRFGRVLYGQRIPALALSLSTFLYYPIKIIADYWGTRGFVTPRDWFQALLPWLLAFHLARRDRPRAWVWSHLLLGLLVYIHPVSAAPWALALWLGSWFFHPARWSWRRRIGTMALCALAFFAAAAPFIGHYLATFSHGATADYDAVYRVTSARFATGFSDIALTFANIRFIALNQYWAQWAAASAVLVWLLLPRERPKLYAAIAWIAALSFISFVVPNYEQAYARAHRVMPVEVDFVRSCRYLFMMLHVLCLWPLSLLGRLRSRALWPSGRAAAGERVKAVAAALAAFAALSWQAHRTPWERYIDDGLAAVRAGRLFERQPTDARTALMKAIAERTPPGSKFMVADNTLASQLRFFALRAVAWSYKDGGPFAYANHAALLRWADEFARCGAGPQGPASLPWWLDEARRLHADYALVPFRVPDPWARRARARLLLSHGAYTVLKL